MSGTPCRRRADRHSGAMGSGKSEMRRLAIKAISEVSSASSGKKGSKVGAQVVNAEVSFVPV